MKRWIVGAALTLLALAASCAAPQLAQRGTTPSRAATPKSTKGKGAVEEGIASYYANSLEGRSTASGEPYRGGAATCAHKTHRFGTKLLVTSLTHGRSVVCRVNDRGPFVRGRIVDLSRSLAQEMGLLDAGLMKVRIEVLEQ